MQWVVQVLHTSDTHQLKTLTYVTVVVRGKKTGWLVAIK